MRQLHRGALGHEGIVWCYALIRNDIVIHFHNKWWWPWRRTFVWAHHDHHGSDRVAGYLVTDAATFTELTYCETWMEAAALLRQNQPQRVKPFRP